MVIKAVGGAQARDLEEEIGGPKIAAGRNPLKDGVASGLTPSRLTEILEMASQGYPEDLLTLAEEIEEREPHYRSVLNTRKMAVASLTMRVEPASDSAIDQAIAEQVEELLGRAEAKRATRYMLDAIAKGYSVVEIVWDTSRTPWEPKEYIWQDPRWFRFDYDTLRDLRLKTTDYPDGAPLAEHKFIVHCPAGKHGMVHRSGLARTMASLYLTKSYGIRNWVDFAQLYGHPLRIGRHAPNATSGDRDELLRAVHALGTNSSVVMPTTMQVETHDGVAGSHGADVFGGLASWCDSQTSKLVLGQTMTADDGSSMSQANVHNEVRKDIIRHDGWALAETLNETVIKSFVRLNYGEETLLPRVVFELEDREDLQAMSSALVPLIDRGLRVSAQEIAARFGIESLNDDGDMLEAPGVEPAEFVRDANRVAPPDSAKRTANYVAENEWERIMDPLVQPVLEAAEQSTSFKQFRGKLTRALTSVDTSTVAQSIAFNTFLARAEGGNTGDE